ncbi:hypothetical protein TWF679_003285 [Orbilia oligospora]|uniref:Uncharacterized protein n=1 Tax=Orbilia oligospora TaxID=2813651 RepID=A0A8H8URQ8_ORBOL|nr:hypothetical protein TWF679_003285 [Orbilia oligospora]
MRSILNKLLSASTGLLQNDHDLIKISLFVLPIGSVAAYGIIYSRALRPQRAANQDIELGEQGLEPSRSGYETSLKYHDQAASSTTESTQTRTVVDLNVGTGAEFTAGARISHFEAEAGDDVEGANEHGFADEVHEAALRSENILSIHKQLCMWCWYSPAGPGIQSGSRG